MSRFRSSKKVHHISLVAIFHLLLPVLMPPDTVWVCEDARLSVAHGSKDTQAGFPFELGESHGSNLIFGTGGS